MLDMLGIALLILLAAIVSLHFAFSCTPHLRTLYTTLFSVLGTAIILAPIIDLHDKYHKVKLAVSDRSKQS